MKKRRKPLDSPVDVLAVGDLASYLKLPVSATYRLVEGRQIPGFKVGRQWRFYRPVLDQWIERKAVTRTTAVLVIDDDPAVCDLFATALAGEDREILTATGGEQALVLAKRFPIAVTVLDLVMPGLKGFSTCARRLACCWGGGSLSSSAVSLEIDAPQPWIGCIIKRRELEWDLIAADVLTIGPPPVAQFVG